MRLRPLNTIFSQVFALVLTCVVVTLALGFGVLAFSPPPPPATVSIASFVEAYATGSNDKLTISELKAPPSTSHRAEGQAEILIGASLAAGIRVKPSDVSIVITAPSMFGLLPRSGMGERGQITIIDVPASLRFPRAGAAFDMNSYLRNNAVKVPPFIATIRQADGRFLQLRPRERFPTAWQLRLLAIFALALLVVVPLAWVGARRWTDTIRRLAARVKRFDAHDALPPLTTPGDAQEVRALEQAFEDLHARIRAHVDERTQMLMAVAHDLRTPLTSIRIRSEEVEKHLRNGFVRDLARLEQMIDGVLAFARSQKPSENNDFVDVAKLAEDLVVEARMRGENVEIETSEAFVRGNAIDLSRVIDNLLRNAHRYATRSIIGVETAGRFVSISVVDDGAGVPEDAIRRLTEPFFRVEQSRSVSTGGLGLGLATVRAIVDAHQGRLAFENLNDGFMVKVSIPALQSDAT